MEADFSARQGGLTRKSRWKKISRNGGLAVFSEA
jgi:hypothetical protein